LSGGTQNEEKNLKTLNFGGFMVSGQVSAVPVPIGEQLKTQVGVVEDSVLRIRSLVDALKDGLLGIEPPKPQTKEVGSPDARSAMIPQAKDRLFNVTLELQDIADRLYFMCNEIGVRTPDNPIAANDSERRIR
jgi:hypothetical protein